MSRLQPKVAISNDALKAFANLQQSQQKKVREWMEKFQKHPTSSGLNYETIQNAKDPNVRSIRIDQKYRAIVVAPKNGDVYLLVWVDNHDEAYAWAINRRFDVNPTTGSLQVYMVDEVEAPEETTAVGSTFPDCVRDGRLFSGILFSDLRKIGVPELLLPSISSMYTEHDLDNFIEYLPQEATDALYMIAAGSTVEEALRDVENEFYANMDKMPDVDVDDFALALAHPDSKQRFVVIDGEEELSEVLNSSMEQWRIFLHPSQQRLVQKNQSGPCRVLGGAGTGKTVALLHRAKHLAEHVFTDADDKILVTTYTANLADELKNQLENICSDAAFSRIEVNNLHSWAVRFMRKEGQNFVFAEPSVKNQAWEMAFADKDLDFPEAFYKEEWEKVVKPQGIIDKRGYFLARRKGRGTPLTRSKRAQAWRIFADYRAFLDSKNVSEWDDLIRESTLCLEKQSDLLRPKYRAVLADEVQDLHEGQLRLLRAMVPEGPNDMFLVGDGHQRIYGHRSSMLQCGIDIRGRGKRLKLNYRTTSQIGRWAVALLKGLEIDDLSDGTDDLRGYHSVRRGTEPEVLVFKSKEDECAAMIDTIKKYLSVNGKEKTDWICVSARSDRALGVYEKALQSEGFGTTRIEKKSASSGTGIRLATMHRMKGLEFSCVILCGVHEGAVPAELKMYADDISKQDHLISERCLMYVSATRARDELHVFGHGKKSPLVNELTK